MPPVIVDMPWPPDPTRDIRRLDGTPVIDPATRQPLRAYHNQILLWASLAPDALTTLPPAFPMFPVLIDTGFTDDFLMQQRQAEEWMTPAVFARPRQNRYQLTLGPEKI